MNNCQEDKLLNALESCKENAEKGYVLAKEATENIDLAIKSISKELTIIINDLQSNNSFNDQPTIKNKQYQAGDYYLFGKQIKLIDNTITDDAYLLMLEDMKTDMYKLYIHLFQEKK